MSKSESLEVVYEGIEKSPESERAESTAWETTELPSQPKEPETFSELGAKVFNEALVKRKKRTESQVLADFSGDLLGQAKYLQDRVTKLEEKLADLFGSVTPEAAALVLKSPGYAHLSRYLP